MDGRILPAIFGPAEKNTQWTPRTEAMTQSGPVRGGSWR